MLKRSYFKRKPIDYSKLQEKRKKKAISVKIKGVKKPKKRPISKLKKDLWELTKQLIRKKYLDDKGFVKCYTCDRLLTEKADMHTAHFIDSSICGANMRYDFDNLRICCYACNVHKNGNKVEYYRRMVNEVGQEKVDEIYNRSKIVIHADSHWYNSMIDKYKQL